MASTNISLEADRHYVELLSLLAKKRRITVGKMVRAALDRDLADDLAVVEKQAAIFFADESASGFINEPKSSGN